jgi:acetyl-CoA C-acetyltransferase
MVAIAGASVTRFTRRTDGTGFRDWAGTAFVEALHRSTLDPADIDCLVVAGESDFFTLQLNPATVLAQDLGLTHATAFRVEGGGASGQLAVHAAAARILAGLSRIVAVVGADATASTLPGDTLRTLYCHSFDAMTDGPTGITATQVYALSWQAFAAAHDLGDDDLARVTIAHRANACANPAAHLPRRHTPADIAASPLIASPYRRLHCSPLSDGAAALILAAPDALPHARRTAPRITGIGAATDRPLGARPDPGAFTAKTRAMQAACRMAGITPSDIGLAEIYDPYAGAALQALHALGLSGQPSTDYAAGRFDRDGTLPVNLSGGLLGQGAAPGATGVAQVATCALLLEGQYHPAAQPARLPRVALADTHGGICSNAAVTVLTQAMAA